VTPADDFPYEMDRFPVFPNDSRDAKVVFGDSSASQLVPEDLVDIAELVHAARRPGSVDELEGEDVITAQIAASIREHAASPRGDADERIRVLSKFRTAKVAVASAAVLVLGATAAAAATCTLPAPVQSSVARSLSDVGIKIPVHHKVELAAKHSLPVAKVGPKVKALHHEHHNAAPGAFGTVTSVNGVSDPGTCGMSGAMGSFALIGPKGKTFTVNVSPSTTYVDKGVTTPTFANLCVGDIAAAKGTVNGAIVTADKVFVAPPPPPHVPTGAEGIVASVNGVSDPGRCGMTGAAGSFTLTARNNKTFTVNVDTSTPFVDPTVTTPSFANVCVGALVHAKGTVVDTTVTATNVFVVPAPEPPEHGHEHEHGVFGAVVSVNGVSTAGTCGTSGATGSFTLTGEKGKTFMVNVDGNTKFLEWGVTPASFATVCVDVLAGAEGDATGTTIAATGVFVLPADTGHHDGFHGHKGVGHFPKGDAAKTTHKGSEDDAQPHHAVTAVVAKRGGEHLGEARHGTRHGH